MFFVWRFQGVQEDIATLQVNVDNINEIHKLLTSGYATGTSTTESQSEGEEGASAAPPVSLANPEFRDKMADEVEQLNRKWAHVLDLSGEQNRRLREALEKSATFLDSVAELEEFTADVQAEHLGREYTVHSQQELDQLHDSFKVRKYNIKCTCKQNMKRPSFFIRL